MNLRLLAAILALALIAGCTGIPPAADEAQEVAGMLANFDRLAALKPEDQRHEFATAQAAHERAPTDATRLHLALTMLLPRAPWRDDARVQSLLGGVETASTERRSARHDLAQLLLRLVAERQRTQRDEQRNEQRKAEQLAQQLREEKRKAEEMQQKIESLRTIDRETYIRRKAP